MKRKFFGAPFTFYSAIHRNVIPSRSTFTYKLILLTSTNLSNLSSLVNNNPVRRRINISSFAYSTIGLQDVSLPQFDGKNCESDYGIHEDYENCDSDDEVSEGSVVVGNPGFFRDLKTILDILRPRGTEGGPLVNQEKLQQCGVIPTPEIVSSVLSRVRNDWETSLSFFSWAGKQPGYAHTVREYHSMISILGKMRKFDTAWNLINNDMRGASLVTPRTLLVMIRKYSAVHDVGRAINTFYAHKRFKFEIGMEEFQGLLSALCWYKNVKDAENLLFVNKNMFPLNTKSFNIILNGWCNVVGDLREGKRIWREMRQRGIKCDVYSYSSIMSCYSKAGNLKAVLKLFDQMNKVGIAPDRKVYNAVIHALAKGKHVKEACNLMKNMEEKGITPCVITYNSLIVPLCKRQQLNESREMFHEMICRGLSPTTRTYHALFRTLRTGEEVFELLERMHKTGCHPSHETYIMLIRKFCRWGQLDNVFKLWTEMSKNGLDPDRSSYIALIHGLFLNGNLEEAYKYYLEMKKKDILPEPKTDEMIQAWLAGGTSANKEMVKPIENTSASRQAQNKPVNLKKNQDFRRQPEIRGVQRERGFSFWEP